MRIKMLITVPGSVDGEVKEYAEGEEYDFLTEAEIALARVFEKQKYGQVIDYAPAPEQSVTIAMTSKKRRAKQP